MLETADLSQNSEDAAAELERLFLFSISWAVAGLLEPGDRLRCAHPDHQYRCPQTGKLFEFIKILFVVQSKC